jgi:hypothetical protein
MYRPPGKKKQRLAPIGTEAKKRKRSEPDFAFVKLERYGTYVKGKT